MATTFTKNPGEEDRAQNALNLAALNLISGVSAARLARAREDRDAGRTGRVVGVRAEHLTNLVDALTVIMPGLVEQVIAAQEAAYIEQARRANGIRPVKPGSLDNPPVLVKRGMLFLHKHSRVGEDSHAELCRVVTVLGDQVYYRLTEQGVGVKCSLADFEAEHVEKWIDRG